MTDHQKKHAKEKIFKAAIILFAEKGYAGVGIREIARTAQVNVAMINYYFGSKLGILTEIIKASHEKYYAAVATGFNEKLSLEERTRLMVRNLIEFFRNHFELFQAANSTPPGKFEEMLDLNLKLVSNGRDVVNRFFTQVGLDVNNNLLMSMIRGAISTLLIEHFHSRYMWEKVYKVPCKTIVAKAPKLTECDVEYNDAYYEEYAEVLARFYLDGVRGLSKSKNQKGGSHA